MANTERYQLWCLVEGAKTPFPVFIESTASILELTFRVRDVCKYPPLGDYFAPDLMLKKDNEDFENCNGIIYTGKYRPKADHKLDHVHRSISEVWPSQPRRGHLHVFVCLPATKRSGDSSEPDVCSRDCKCCYKVAKLDAAPSRITQTSESTALQRNQDEKTIVLYDRPEPHPDIPHVALLYDGFGEFLDIFHGRKEVSGLEPWKQRALELRINDFADEMASFYGTERDRRFTAIPEMDLILTALVRKGQMGPEAFLSGAFDPPMSVGKIKGEHGAMSCIVLFKNECCDIEIMPYIELTNHVARSFNEAMTQGRNRELFQDWKVPCLGITVVGFEVTFYAIVFLGQNRYRIANLTPGLLCRSSAEDSDGRKTLYSAFMAATVLMARIWEDTKKATSNPPSTIFFRGTHCFPCLSALPRYNEGLPGTLNFDIVRPLARGSTNSSLLYIAIVRDGDKDKEIIVKFTRRYCIELHTFCAVTGNAPRILGYQKLPGNWIAIAMEYVSAQSITKAPGRNKRRKQWAAAARKLVKSFHDRGWVHGDLRDVNILCGKHRLMLVDFNWGGKDGEACYPTSILPEELWEACQAAGDLKIRKENDIRALEMTLTKIGVC